MIIWIDRDVNIYCLLNRLSLVTMWARSGKATIFKCHSELLTQLPVPIRKFVSRKALSNTPNVSRWRLLSNVATFCKKQKKYLQQQKSIHQYFDCGSTLYSFIFSIDRLRLLYCLPSFWSRFARVSEYDDNVISSYIRWRHWFPVQPTSPPDSSSSMKMNDNKLATFNLHIKFSYLFTRRVS